MTQSTRLSSRSAGCRLEWRPSRWLSGALLVIGLCAGIALLASDLPVSRAWPCALLATVAGAWQARRESRRPCRLLLIRSGAEPLAVDGILMQEWALQWRGPLAFLSWRDADGRTRRLSWWPDTLPADLRRELRLAVPAGAASRRRRSMAP